METNRCAIIAGSVIVGALLLKRFTTVLGAETRVFNTPPIRPPSTTRLGPPLTGNGTPWTPTTAGNGASSSQNPCDQSNLVAEKKKIDAWEKKQKHNLTKQIASTTTEANAERRGVDSQITQSKKDCAAKMKAEKEAAAKARAAKMAAEKLAAQKAKEAKRQTDVATATTAIETASKQTGFFAAFTAWMKSWGQDKTTDVPVVADENTIARTIPPVAQSGMQGMY